MTDRKAELILIGGPTVLIEIGSFRLLTDPTFDAPGCYEARGIKLQKSLGPAIDIDEIDPIDAVLLSHDQHFDNLDRLGRTLLGRAKRTFTTKAGAERLGAIATGLAPWQTVRLEAPDGEMIHVTATPARHGPAGIEPVTGDVVGFLIGIEAPGDAVYVSGDTVWYDGVAEVARRYQPKLAILFAGAAKPRGAFHVTMDNNDAIEAAGAFGEATIVAIHNSGWRHFTESQDDLAHAFGVVGAGQRLKRLEAGHRTQIAL